MIPEAASAKKTAISATAAKLKNKSEWFIVLPLNLAGLPQMKPLQAASIAPLQALGRLHNENLTGFPLACPMYRKADNRPVATMLAHLACGA